MALLDAVSELAPLMQTSGLKMSNPNKVQDIAAFHAGLLWFMR